MFEVARKNAMDSKHPQQAAWHRYWLGLVGITLGDAITAPPDAPPPKQKGRRVSRPRT